MTIASSATVESIHVSHAKGEPLDAVLDAELVQGQGIVGDRRFSLSTKAMNQVTLIEAEALDAACTDLGNAGDAFRVAGISRRNLVTRGVALNHLVGRTFLVGTATLRGIELCEPCGHLAKVVSSAFSRALVHRGGLRCEIVESGRVRPGDAVRSA